MIMYRNYHLLLIFIIFMTGFMNKQGISQVQWDYEPPRGYVAYKAENPLEIDGIHEDAWGNASWSEYFNDIEGAEKSEPRYRTRMKMLWDENYLYVYAELEEPHVWGYQKKRDAIIYYENDFEMFIKPPGMDPRYGEFEMNAQGTAWDLFFCRPYRSGADYMVSWDMREMKVGVKIRGTLNDPGDTDQGWNVELAFPWEDLKELGRKKSLSDGDIWRINFSRVEWQHIVNSDGKYARKPGLKENNWTWSPQRVINMHEPEFWGYLQLSEKFSGNVKFERPLNEPVLQALFYLLRAKKYDKEAKNITDLIGDNKIRVKGITMNAGLELTRYGFNISVVNPEDGKKYIINERENIIIF